MTEILPIGRKTLSNQSINQSLFVQGVSNNVVTTVLMI